MTAPLAAGARAGAVAERAAQPALLSALTPEHLAALLPALRRLGVPAEAAAPLLRRIQTLSPEDTARLAVAPEGTLYPGLRLRRHRAREGGGGYWVHLAALPSSDNRAPSAVARWRLADTKRPTVEAS